MKIERLYDKTFTVEEFSQMLKVHPNTVYMLIDKNIISARKPQKRWYISGEELKKLVVEKGSN